MLTMFITFMTRKKALPTQLQKKRYWYSILKIVRIWFT